MEFFYIRHGEPVYDPDSLTNKGHEQARLLTTYFLNCGLNQIYSSTSVRAIQTAKPTCDALGLVMQLVDFANEKYAYKDFSIGEGSERSWLSGNWMSRTLFASKEIRELGFQWYNHAALSKYKYEKGVERVYNDCDKFFLSIGYEHIRYTGKYNVISHSDKKIALFAHEGFGKIFLSCMLDIPYPYICNCFNMSHTGVTKIRFIENDGEAVPVVDFWSSQGHLYKFN